jgi:hypothetical protein
MADFTFSRKFDKMTPEQKQQYFADLRQQAASLYGKNESVAGSGFSMSDIDAAIARKEKKS